MDTSSYVYKALAIFLGYVSVSAIVRLIENVWVSRKSGLPTIVMAFHPMNIFYLLTQDLYRPIISRLPFGLAEWKYLHFLYRDWAMATKNDLFAAYGDVIVLASSGGRVVVVGDAEVANQLVSRRQDFPKDVNLYKSVRFYGDSVLTTEGDAWRTHRKITAPPFSESVHTTVWTEALVQIKAMIPTWISSSRNSPEGLGILPDTKTLMRNVLSKAGFGITLPFISSNAGKQQASESPDLNSGHDSYFSPTKVPEGRSMCYGDALDWMLEHMLLVSIVPRALLRRGPQSWRKTANAYDDVGNYLRRLIQLEHERGSNASSRTILSALVRSADSEGKSESLSEDEVIGNLFVMAIAGLETTAGTLQYAILHLALCQDEQEWLYDDLQRELQREDEDPEKWDYAIVFPKLVACLCVINEILRLHPTFLALAKRTENPQAISYKGTHYTIPEDTSVFLCMIALHYNPAYWGDDVNHFRPRNWDARSENSGWFSTEADGTRHVISQDTQPGKAPFCHVRQPLKGSYLPFSGGVRTCLGKNFAIVELCAFLAVLFRSYRIVIATRDGETQEAANKRAYDTIERGTQQMLTLALREDIGIRVFKRT